jgi:hypothetical protein
MPDSTLPIDIPIADPDSPASPWWILLVTASIFVIVAVGMTMHHLFPGDPLPLYITGAAVALAIVLPLILWRLIHRVGITVVADKLCIHTGVGSRAVALSNLRANGLELIDLAHHPELDTSGKSWSATAPDLKTGLYRLRSGEQALLVLTDPHRVCRLRSDADALTLLLSLKRPDQLRAMLDR